MPEPDRRAGRIEGWRATLAQPNMPRPADGMPQNIADHMRLMCDILVLGFQTAVGNAGHPVVASLIAHERVIVFVFWGLIALGLVIAVPAAIIDGAFD